MSEVRSEPPQDLMEKARAVAGHVYDPYDSKSAHEYVTGLVARALAEERERWQIPPSHMGIPVRLDPNVPPGEVRLDANGAVIGTFTASRP